MWSQNWTQKWEKCWCTLGQGSTLISTNSCHCQMWYNDTMIQWYNVINISNTNNLNSTQVKSVNYFNNSSQYKGRTWVKTMCASTCRKTRVSTCHLTRDSRCFIHVRAHACCTCEHVLPTRASTLLVVRARLLFKNVRPGWICCRRSSSWCSRGQRTHPRWQFVIYSGK